MITYFTVQLFQARVNIYRLSIPKLQRLHRCSLGKDKYFHPTPHSGWNEFCDCPCGDCPRTVLYFYLIYQSLIDFQYMNTELCYFEASILTFTEYLEALYHTGQPIYWFFNKVLNNKSLPPAAPNLWCLRATLKINIKCRYSIASK